MEHNHSSFVTEIFSAFCVKDKERWKSERNAFELWMSRGILWCCSTFFCQFQVGHSVFLVPHSTHSSTIIKFYFCCEWFSALLLYLFTINVLHHKIRVLHRSLNSLFSFIFRKKLFHFTFLPFIHSPPCQWRRIFISFLFHFI